MVRAIASVVVGYLAMLALVLATVFGAQLALGDERFFEPGTYNLSTAAMMLGLVLRSCAAVVGGLVCRAIARSTRPAMTLAALALAVGVVSALMNEAKPDPGPRLGAVTPLEAAAKVRKPRWYAFTIPLIAATGVIGGARSGSRANAKTPGTPSGPRPSM
jgi:hypothetical protein